MSSPFAVTTASNSVNLDAKRHGEAPFTVFNSSGRPIRGRARLVPENSEAGGWLSLAGTAERDFPIAGTEQYTAHIAVPGDVPAGSHAFHLDMVGVENPDEMFTQGPTVSFEVPEAAPAKAFPWWILLLIGGVLALVVICCLAAYFFWPRTVVVPDVSGSTVAEAEEQLAQVDLNTSQEVQLEFDDSMEEGLVIRTDPAAKEEVKRGSEVMLIVSQGQEHGQPDAKFSYDTSGSGRPLSIWFHNESSGDITTYIWDFGDGETSADENPTHAFAKVGIYDVRLTVAGPGGTDTAQESISTITPPAEPVGLELVLNMPDADAGVHERLIVAFENWAPGSRIEFHVTRLAGWTEEYVDKGVTSGSWDSTFMYMPVWVIEMTPRSFHPWDDLLDTSMYSMDDLAPTQFGGKIYGIPFEDGFIVIPAGVEGAELDAIVNFVAQLSIE